VFGWGKSSTPAYLKAAQKPSATASVATTIDSATGNLVISLAAPSNNGDSVFKYYIDVQKKTDSTAWISPATCVGTSAGVLSTLSCQVPMDTLTSATYAY